LSSQQTSPNKQQLQLSPKQQQQSLPLQTVANKDRKPKRTGSLGLFFRKVTTNWWLVVSVSLSCMCFVRRDVKPKLSP
jgi:hypothetical protein